MFFKALKDILDVRNEHHLIQLMYSFSFLPRNINKWSQVTQPCYGLGQAQPPCERLQMLRHRTLVLACIPSSHRGIHPLLAFPDWVVPLQSHLLTHITAIKEARDARLWGPRLTPSSQQPDSHQLPHGASPTAFMYLFQDIGCDFSFCRPNNVGGNEY